MRYESESEMYPDVCRWLKDFLASRFQSADVDVYDLSQTPISRFLRNYNVRDNFHLSGLHGIFGLMLLDLFIIHRSLLLSPSSNARTTI